MKKTACFILMISWFFIFCAFQSRQNYALPDYGKNSSRWQTHNSSYIPSAQEQEILSQRNSLVPNSEDYDGDGLVNQFDPSPYDWREIGYQPFAVLAFLSWDHQWNHYAFKGKNLDQAVASLKKLGISFVRMDFAWSDIEPRQGTWDFEKYDRIVKLLSENNIRILGVCGYSTGWASSSPEFLWNYPPAKNEYYTTFVVKVINRYKDRIKYWEPWNEPDSSAYWKPQDMMVRYTSLLKDTYTAAKKEDPTCKILLGGLAQGYKLEWVYNNGGKNYFDIVNFHILLSPLNPAPLKAARGAVAQVKRVMERFGDGDKRIWITEMGCPGVPEDYPVRNWWNGKNPTEQQQAAWVKEVFSEFIEEPLVDKVFWAFFRDTKNHFGNGVDYFGLIRWDFSEKPAYTILEEIIQNWESPKEKS